MRAVQRVPLWGGVVVTLLLVAACVLAEPVPPVAEAGDTITVSAGADLRLDASGSFDPDGGTIVRYRWTIVGAPADRAERLGEVLADGSDPVVVLEAPFGPQDVGRWELELEVTDETGHRATDTIFVEVEP